MVEKNEFGQFQLANVAEMNAMHVLIDSTIYMIGKFEDVIIPAVVMAAALHAPINGANKSVFLLPKRMVEVLYSSSYSMDLTIDSIRNETTDRVARHTGAVVAKDVDPTSFSESFWKSLDVTFVDTYSSFKVQVNELFGRKEKPGFVFVGRPIVERGSLKDYLFFKNEMFQKNRDSESPFPIIFGSDRSNWGLSNFRCRVERVRVRNAKAVRVYDLDDPFNLTFKPFTIPLVKKL